MFGVILSLASSRNASISQSTHSKDKGDVTVGLRALLCLKGRDVCFDICQQARDPWAAWLAEEEHPHPCIPGRQLS